MNSHTSKTSIHCLTVGKLDDIVYIVPTNRSRSQGTERGLKMKNKQWMLRAVGVISALALGLGGLAACGNSSSAESKNGRVYYLNKKAEEQST